MAKGAIKIDCPGTAFDYVIDVGDVALASCGKWARRCLGKGTERVVIVSNPTIFKIYGERVRTSLAGEGFDVLVWLMKDGEQHKNWKSAGELVTFLGENKITRTDALVALGGGVVGDLTGFAASIHLRGIAFLQIPTTLLSMIDSSVGGKTGVNSAFGKNSIGAFYQPKGVLVDTETLATLPVRELTAGFCEAIKQGAIANKTLLNNTSDLLGRYRVGDIAEHIASLQFRSELNDLVRAQIQFKASIVANDERESTGRRDARSRKILNFGHTLAHALEKATDYRYFKHGEAVGYGILYAAELSKKLAHIDEKVVNLLYDVVHRAGALPPLNDLDPQGVFEAFRFDKKLVSGSLQMILLKGIGKPLIVNSGDIPRTYHVDAFKQLLKKYKRP